MKIDVHSKATGLVLSGVYILLVGLTAINAVGYHHGDEHYQIIEFANYYLGNKEASSLPWEFHKQMRPSLQPLIVAFFMNLFDESDLANPYKFMVFMRMLTGFLGVFVYFRFIRHVLLKNIVKPNYMLVFGAFCFWFFPHLLVRFSSENFASIMFFWGVVEYFRKEPRYLFSGFLLGISCVFRFQMGFALIGLLIYIVYHGREGWAERFKIFYGGVLSLIALLPADRVFYGKWVLTPFKYIEQNLIQDKAASFGVSPWYSYFEFLWNSLTPAVFVVVVVMVLFVYFQKKNHWTIFVLVPFFVAHSLVGHKEFRFLFPVVFIFPVLFIEAYQLAKKEQRLNKLSYGIYVLFFGLNIFGLLLMTQVPSGTGNIKLANTLVEIHPNESAYLYHKGYANPFEPWPGNVASFYKDWNKKIETIHLEDLYSLDTIKTKDEIPYYLMVRQMDWDFLGIAPNQMKKQLVELDRTYPIWIERVGIWFGLVDPQEVYLLYEIKT